MPASLENLMLCKTRSARLFACAAVATAMLAPAAWAGGSSATLGSGAMKSAAVAAVPTDRMIVKYRDVQTIARSAAAGPVRADRLAALKAAAAQHGVQLSHLRNNALGAHVLKLDKRLNAADAAALAARLKAQDPSIEYA